MNRRQFLGAGVAGAMLSTVPLQAQIPPPRTRWVVRGSEGFDALSFLSPLAGDPFYLRYYEREVAAFAPRMPAAAMDALRALKARVTQAGILLSPSLDMRFSGGPDATIDDLVASLDNAETVLRPPFEASSYWGARGEENWRQFLAARPTLRMILVGLRDAGFAQFRTGLFDPVAADRLPALRARLAAVDVVGEVEHFTGRRLDAQVEVVLLHFCKPHGIKVIGQKFLSAIDWSDDIVIRTAGHELLHPPVALDGPAARAALAILREDALLQRIVSEHDPAFGYNSLEGIFDEDLASSLDQLIAERLGSARDPRERWTDVDGGMHVLSAAFYGLMQQTGFARTGGDLERWLMAAAAGGLLAPASLHAAAARILGRPADRLWPPPPPPAPARG